MRYAVGLLVSTLIGCSDRPLPFPLPDGDGPSTRDLGPSDRDLGRPAATSGDTVLDACVTFASCGLDPQFASTEYCGAVGLQLLEPNVLPREAFKAGFECLVAAGSDCEAARHCFDFAKTGTSCPPAPTCDGDVIRGCVGTRLAGSFDCSSIGQKCIQYGSGLDASCGFGTCSVSEEQGRLHCRGNLVTRCVAGQRGNDGVVVVAADCGAVGATCDPTGGGGSCHAESCDSFPICVGDSVVSCGSRSGITFFSYTNCDFFGCQDGACRAPPARSGSHVECQGTTLVVSGQRVDCVALGFTGCDATAGGRCTR